MVIFPCAGVHRAAAQTDDDRKMFDADGALVFAGPAGGALEIGGHGVVLADNVFARGGTKFVEIAAEAEDDFLRVEFLAGVVRRAVFGAAAALHAGVGLQADELREIGSSNESEVFIANQRRNFAEAATRKKDGGRAENEVEVLGVRNDGQKDEQGQCVRPPENACGGAVVR